MSMPSNLYQKSPPAAMKTDDDDNILMKDSSPSSKNSLDASNNMHGDEKQEEDQSPCSETSNAKAKSGFDEHPFQIPPSFSRPITKETLCDVDHPYVFWASLRLPIPKDPVNPMAAVFNALEEFVSQLADEDPNFVVFPTILATMNRLTISLLRSRQWRIFLMTSMNGLNISQAPNRVSQEEIRTWASLSVSAFPYPNL